MNISTTEYQRLAYRTAKQFGDIKLDLIHAAIGAGSEVGELAEAILGPKNYTEELGDIAWYLALAATVIGAEFGEMFHNDSKEQYFVNCLGIIQYKATASAMYVLASAVGEVQTMVKGIFCYGKELNSLALQMKVRDAFYALLMMAEVLRCDWTEVGDHNIAKLRKRYPDKYNDVDAVARADKEGSDELTDGSAN